MQVLKGGHTLEAPIIEDLPEKRILRNSQLPFLIPIGHMDNFYGIRQQRDAVRFHEAQHDCVVRYSFYPKDGVGATIELLYSINNGASEDSSAS